MLAEGRFAALPELEQTAWDCAGYCDLDMLVDGKLVGLIAGSSCLPELEST